MSDSDSKSQGRKDSSIDLQQIVVRVNVYIRPLNSSGGKSGAVFGIGHEAGVATTENGRLFLIEKGADDDINYPIRYLEGECCIAHVTQRDIRNWQLVRSVEQVNPGVTLEALFVSCGDGYSFLTDNCWNCTQRMRVNANESEDGLTWQEKGAIGAAVVVTTIGVGAILAAALSGDSKDKDKDKKKAQKR